MLQGITGIAFINVQGAGPNDPPLRDEESDARPVIPATPSQFSQLFASAPDLLVKGIQLAEQLNQVFGPENQALLRGTLQDLRAFSATLSEQRERLASLLAELERDGQAMRAAANNFNTAAESADQFFSDGRETLQSAKATLDSADQALSGELKNLLREASTAAAGFAGAANELQAMLADTREPLRDFSEEGLVEFTEAAREAKRFTRDLSRLVDRLDQRGLRYLLEGGGQEGYNPEIGQ
jgi:phospholipid/cholesterol/gamma-HCH transport system substrate-binding protein